MTKAILILDHPNDAALRLVYETELTERNIDALDLQTFVGTFPPDLAQLQAESSGLPIIVSRSDAAAAVAAARI